MAHEFVLPDIGEGLTEAEIVAWHVAVGDDVATDQVLVEVETAKAVVDIPSPHAGVVLYLGGAEGDTVDVGAVLVVIGEAGETWEPAGTGAPPAEESVRAMPAVRKLADSLGVDLATVAGSGPGGSITRADIEAAAGGGRRELSATRRAIAEHMSRSWREIPHVTVQAEFDATQLLAAHRVLRESGPAPLEALIAKAVIPALTGHPEFNATLEGNTLVLKEQHDLGFAVDTDRGLVVVVVRDVAMMGADELAARIVDLADRAKARTATPEELTGQTFTISNIGALGGGHGTPIIPWGTTAILSVGRAVDSAVVRDGAIVVAPMAPLSLSYDHRVIDGALGQRFLTTLVENLETVLA
jgi:pyruvate dehydrogenase E2 component (dihydrolipoamide acetyltransferase)